MRILLIGRDRRDRAVPPPRGLPASRSTPARNGWDDEPDHRRSGAKKDASRSCCAEAVRDGKADAMVGAGNTGATMAACNMRHGPGQGVARPAIALLIPVPARRHPRCWSTPVPRSNRSTEWLVQFAHGSGYARALRNRRARGGLLSNGEEAGKGDALRKAALRAAGRRAGVPRQRRGPRFYTRARSS